MIAEQRSSRQKVRVLMNTTFSLATISFEIVFCFFFFFFFFFFSMVCEFVCVVVLYVCRFYEKLSFSSSRKFCSKNIGRLYQVEYALEAISHAGEHASLSCASCLWVCCYAFESNVFFFAVFI